jgi:predicted transcriptional regulator
MQPRPKRPKEEIIQEMLQVCQQPQRPTWLMMHLRISWKDFKRKLAEAKRNKLIQDYDKNAYQTTTKGLMYLIALDQANTIIQNALA